jgi:hypothetical protein
MAVTEEQMESLVEDITNTIDEAVEDTTRFSMEEALEYYETVLDHVQIRINGMKTDIANR